MYKEEKTSIIGTIIIIIVLTALVIITNIDISRFSVVEGLAQKFVMPIQNGLVYLKNKINGNTAFFDDINHLKEENQELKKENQELNKQLSELGIIKAENKTLREYAGLTDQYTKYNTIPAYIINRDISNFSNTLVINVGKKDGVEANMAVVCADGVVGHIISSTETTSKVQTIIDPSSNVSAIASISRDNIIIKGSSESSNKLKGSFISADANLIINDDIETSGIGGIYPKGLKIGKLIEIQETQNITEKYAIVETAVDFARLETVLVIIKK